jgi:hypothetical protein
MFRKYRRSLGGKCPAVTEEITKYGPCDLRETRGERCSTDSGARATSLHSTEVSLLDHSDFALKQVRFLGG